MTEKEKVRDSTQVQRRIISQSSLSPLQLVQNAAARLLTVAHKHDNVTPYQHLFTGFQLIKGLIFKVLLFVFKSFHGSAPPYLSDLLHPIHTL